MPRLQQIAPVRSRHVGQSRVSRSRPEHGGLLRSFLQTEGFKQRFDPIKNHLLSQKSNLSRFNPS